MLFSNPGEVIKPDFAISFTDLSPLQFSGRYSDCGDVTDNVGDALDVNVEEVGGGFEVIVAVSIGDEVVAFE